MALFMCHLSYYICFSRFNILFLLFPRVFPIFLVLSLSELSTFLNKHLENIKIDWKYSAPVLNGERGASSTCSSFPFLVSRLRFFLRVFSSTRLFVSFLVTVHVRVRAPLRIPLIQLKIDAFQNELAYLHATLK